MSDPSSPNYPLVQISLDLTNLADALEMAEIAVSAGVDWLEAGTPLPGLYPMNDATRARYLAAKVG